MEFTTDNGRPAIRINGYDELGEPLPTVHVISVETAQNLRDGLNRFFVTQASSGPSTFIAIPRAVEALRWDGKNIQTLRKFLDGLDRWLEPNDCDRRPLLYTPDGSVRIEPGDWIVRDERGTFSCCRAADFPSQYQPPLPNDKPDTSDRRQTPAPIA